MMFLGHKSKKLHKRFDLIMIAVYMGIGALSGFWSFNSLFFVWAIGAVLMFLFVGFKSRSTKDNEIQSAIEKYKNNKANNKSNKLNLHKKFVLYNQSYNAESIFSDNKNEDNNYVNHFKNIK